jgi:aryl-alcohol dehydrogenase-like predicted oxidoreductase
MDYRRLGKSGLIVSAVGLGTNNIGGRTDEAASVKVLDAALDAGINFIDTSNTYTRTLSEQIIGKWMKGKQRDQVIIATKFGKPMHAGPYGRGASRMHIMREVEGSLKRLQTDYIDLYQQHEPDPETPIEETLRTLDDLVSQGKVRYIGTSNFLAWQIVEAQWAAKEAGTVPFISEQPHYSLLEREVDKEISGVCRTYGVGIIPFYPLEGGLLTGKYKRGQPPPPGTRIAGQRPEAQQRTLSGANFDKIEKLESFADQRERGLTELAVAWLLANPAVGSVIAGATKPEQVQENVKGADWKLGPQDLEEIDRIVPVG